jgi:hypothetical protein
VRTALTFMLCSPTINFLCGTNSTISPITHRTQRFHHMTTHVHNIEDYYKLRVQFSCHKDFRLTQTLTGSPVNVWPEDVFTCFYNLRLWYHLLESAAESDSGIYTHVPAALIPLVRERSGIRLGNLYPCAGVSTGRLPR